MKTIFFLFFVFAVVSCLEIKGLSASCLCDVSDSCDYQCCCDAECSKILTEQLSKYGKCDDDNFGIPLCAGFNQTDINIQDMYSGLHTIYTIIKRLFCLNSINIVDVPSYYISQSSTSQIDSIIQSAKTNDEMISAQRPNINSLQSLNIKKAFIGNSIGICQITNKIPKLQRIPTKGTTSTCLTNIQSSNIANHSILSIQQLYTDSSFSSVKIYSVNSTKANSIAAVAPTCSNGICNNVLKMIKIYLNEAGTVNTDYSYAFLGDVQLNSDQTDSQNAYIQVEYSYQFLNSNSTLPKQSNAGYTIGSALILVNSVGSSYVSCPNPVNLAYRTGNNICRTANNTSENSFISFEFGKDGQYGCIGLTSLVYENLKASFNYVAKYGSASTSLADYASISWPNIDATSSVRLTFNFIKIGSAQNWQYQIIRVDAAAIQSISGQSTLYVQYMEVTNQKTLYIPEPPQVDAYLPNDFLYPFYVAG